MMKRLLLLLVVLVGALFTQQTYAQTCTGPLTVTVTGSGTGLPLGGSITGQTNVLCFGQSTGSVTVTGSGGTTPYQYKLGSGSYQSSGTFTGLAAGGYIVTVKDTNLCTFNVTVTITEPASGITASATVTSNYNGSPLSCNGATDGAITVTASGGTGTLEYSINGGTSYQSSNVFAGLGAGPYTITVRDANLCTTTATATISAPTAVSATASVSSNYNGSQLSCNGATNGAITVTASGGTGSLQYSINGGTSYQSSNVFTGLGAGPYTITVKDTNNCTTTATATITAPAAVSATASVSSNYNGSQLSCNGATDGAITVSASGGTGSLQYSINGGTSYQSSPIFTGLGAGIYTITVKDTNNCTTTATDTITAPAVVSATAAVTSNYNGSHISCPTSTDGTITVTASGGTGSLQYSINGGTSYQSSNIFTGLGAGPYTITVKDVNNCTTTATTTVVAPTGVSITSATVTSNSGALFSGYGVSCAVGQGTSNNGQITVVAAGGSGTMSYSVNGGTAQGTGVFSSLTAGSYIVVVTDGNACPATDTVVVTAPTPITAGTCTPAQDLCQLSGGQVKVEVAGGVTPYSVAGSGLTVAPSPTVGTAVSVTGSPATIATSGGNTIFSGLQGNVQYQFIITDANGCQIP